MGLQPTNLYFYPFQIHHCLISIFQSNIIYHAISPFGAYHITTEFMLSIPLNMMLSDLTFNYDKCMWHTSCNPLYNHNVIITMSIGNTCKALPWALSMYPGPLSTEPAHNILHCPLPTQNVVYIIFPFGNKICLQGWLARSI